jgi:hypothetical protein
MHRALPLVIFGISTAALAFEIQLLRLLSIQHWHQFASMIISLALLGYAGSGVLLTLIGELSAKQRLQILLGAGRGLVISMPVCAWAAQRIPFNGLEVLWNPQQLLLLGAIFLTLSLPFFLAGLCIILAFQLLPDQMGRIYAADLMGAAIGAAASALALTLLSPAAAIAVCALIAAVATLVPRVGQSVVGLAFSMISLGLVLVLGYLGWPALKISEFKGQSSALQVSGAHIENEVFSRFGYLAAVANDQIPLRYAPGMSLVSGREPPDQVAIFHDGDRMMAITAAGDEAFARESIMAAPYAVLQRPAVLVLGAGTGNEIRRALVHQAGSVMAIEPNADLVSLVRDHYGAFNGGVFEDQRVQILVDSPRHFLASTDKRYDLVVLEPDQSLAAAAAGIGSAKSSYGFTRQALAAALDRAKPAGLITFSGWVNLPPRHTLKLLGALREALLLGGAEEVSKHVVVLRSWAVVTVLASPTPISPATISSLSEFARSRGFDLACFPGINGDIPNRFNRWREAYLYQACLALLGPDHAAFARHYQFDISSPHDDRPYAWHSFRFSLLPQLWGQQVGTGRALLDSGYLVLFGTTLVAAAGGALLLLMPVLAGRHSRQGIAPVAGFFGLIGMGFMFYEIYMIEKLTLWLGQPLQAFALAVAAILIAAGLGSGLSKFLARRQGSTPGLLGRATALIVLMLAVTLTVVHFFEIQILAAPLAGRVVIGIAVIMPVAFCFGLYLPLGLSVLAESRPGMLPWAWAFNGAASVVSAAFASLLALDFGLSMLPAIAAGCYCLALVSANRWQSWS